MRPDRPPLWQDPDCKKTNGRAEFGDPRAYFWAQGRSPPKIAPFRWTRAVIDNGFVVPAVTASESAPENSLVVEALLTFPG